MNYSVVKRANPIDKGAAALYYAQPVWGTEIGLRAIAQQISKYSTLTITDVSAVLASFTDMFPMWLGEGHSVRLGSFGILRLTFRSDGKEREEDVKKKKKGMVRQGEKMEREEKGETKKEKVMKKEKRRDCTLSCRSCRLRHQQVQRWLPTATAR